MRSLFCNCLLWVLGFYAFLLFCPSPSPGRPRGELRVSSGIASSGMPSLPCLAGFWALLCLHWHGTNFPLTSRSPCDLRRAGTAWQGLLDIGCFARCCTGLTNPNSQNTWRAGANSVLQIWKLSLKELQTASQSFFYPSKKINIFETRVFYAQPPKCSAGTWMTLWKKTQNTYLTSSATIGLKSGGKQNTRFNF